MKITYDPAVDVVRIVLNDHAVMESDEERSGVILDYDGDGQVIGMEILQASRRMNNPMAVEYAILGQE